MITTFQEPYVSLFLIIVFGVLLSKIKIKGIGLGSSAIVLVAIILGRYGFSVPPSIEKIGLILFIFAVGIQAGPGFFESFKTGEARRYLKVVTLTLTLIFVISLTLSKLLGFDYLLAAGLFSGVTTSTPALATIVENSHSKLPIITYTIAYPISLVTIILIFRFLPKILKIDIDKEEKKHNDEILKLHPKIHTEYYTVANPNLFNKSIADIKFHRMTNAIISRIQRNNDAESLIPIGNTTLKEGDNIKVIGDKNSLDSASLLIGPSSDKKIKLSPQEEIIFILVTGKDVIGKSLAHLNLDTLWGAEITQIRRSGVTLAPKGTTRLRFGDKIQVSVPKENSENLIKMLGGIESTSIDFLPIALSIVLGIIIGQISIPIANTNIGPGISGGILFTTLVLGRIGKTGPLLWTIAGRTNQFLRELGIMFFLCGVGSAAGKNFMSAFSQAGMKTIFASIFISATSTLLAVFIISKIQKMNKLRLIGALAGSLTCAAALPPAEDIKGSTIPLTAYSVSYPFALLLTILFGQIYLILM